MGDRPRNSRRPTGRHLPLLVAAPLSGETVKNLLDQFRTLETIFKDLAILVGVLVSMAVIGRLVLRSWQLLHRCLFYEHFFPAWRIIKEIAFCFRYVPKTYSLFRAVRLRVELEALNPRPTRSFEEAGDWRERFREWRSYRKELGEWRQKIRAKLAELAASARSDHRPLDEVENCFSLYNQADAIRRYLTVVSTLRGEEEQKGRFILRVRIRDGFLAPMHLVTGLVSHFHEDWKPVLNDFVRAVDQGYPPLNIFLFDCWLVWGPSIPLCTCSQWRDGVAPQFGFGDENNSTPVYLPVAADLDSIRQSLERARGIGARHPATGFRATLTGTLQLGRTIRHQEVARAQAAILDPASCDFVLEYESHLEKAYREKEPEPGYYSAYVWVMFELEEGPAPPPQNGGDKPWLRLLPFWEHCNIADASTYEALKGQLARKVLTFVQQQLPAYPRLRLRYACAFDHSGCGKELFFPPEGKRIREMIEELLKESPYRQLREHLVFGDPAVPTNFPSCHLPEVVTKFYKDVDIYTAISLSREISLQWQQLDVAPRDMELLERIWRELFEREFPNLGGRKELANMKRHLKSRLDDRKKRNCFHVLVLLSDDELVGASVSRYLGEANAGIIELLAVAEGWRNKGIGRRIAQQTEQMLREDAAKVGNRGELGFIVMETADPEGGEAYGTLAPFERARALASWGFGRLDVPAPPAGSKGKTILAAKTIAGDSQTGVAAEQLKSLLAGYSRWAGGSDHPERSAGFARTAEYLATQRTVEVKPLIARGGVDELRKSG
ncbi:GNAT family N-acetyltransferase [Geobacter sp.]|uniref:GNAT family N-acetyltransferase n=1 Tax=Geobacter sp. TaxID=46610 RepID=UPI00260D7EBE|nr:GNAT family N-acetyltransferase [Geobacter sp.]